MHKAIQHLRDTYEDVVAMAGETYRGRAAS